MNWPHSPYFSIINVHLLDINVFAKFYEIPSLPFQDIEKPYHRRWIDRLTDGRMDNVKTVYTPQPPRQTQFGGGIKIVSFPESLPTLLFWGLLYIFWGHLRIAYLKTLKNIETFLEMRHLFFLPN